MKWADLSLWAKAAAKKKEGENIPAPLHLPQKREKSDDLKGNAYDEVTVYPSPADQKIFVEIENSEATEIKLYNMQGRMVKRLQLNLKERNDFSVADLSNGIYLMQLHKSDGSNTSQKISIQH